MDNESDLLFDEYIDSIRTGRIVNHENSGYYLDSKRDIFKPNVYGQITEDYINKVKCIDENVINGRNMVNNIFYGYISREHDFDY